MSNAVIAIMAGLAALGTSQRTLRALQRLDSPAGPSGRSLLPGGRCLRGTVDRHTGQQAGRRVHRVAIRAAGAEEDGTRRVVLSAVSALDRDDRRIEHA